MTITPEKLLLEEWKQNVALYIDQDKRGLERIRIFLTVHAGLLALYGFLLHGYVDLRSLIIGILISIMGLAFSFITHRMSKRAHACVILRRLQGMLIERKLKELLAPEKQWKTSSGIITTFTRERASFRRAKPKDRLENDEWQYLLDEIDEMAPGISDPVTLRDHWKRSMSHLTWLLYLHYGFYFLWGCLLGYSIFAYVLDC